MRRLTLEDAKKEFLERGYFLLETSYVNNKVKMSYKCLNHADKGELSIRFVDLKNGHGCPYCASEKSSQKSSHPKRYNPRYSIEEVASYFSERGYKLLEEKYVKSNIPLRYLCPSHPDKNLTISLSELKRGKGCAYCAGTARLAFKDVKQAFEDAGYELLESQYINSRAKMRYKCPNHQEKELYTTYTKLSIGRGCPYCAKLGKPSYNEVYSTFADRGYVLLEKEYKNSSTKMAFICNKHPFEELSITYNHLKQGIGCRHCAAENSRGENSPRWKGGVTTLNNFLRSCLNNWKQASISNYSNKCFVTGEQCDRLDIHHTKPFHIIRDEVLLELQLPVYETISEYDESQLEAMSKKLVEYHQECEGIPLKPDIHKLFHSIYGHNAGLEELNEFKERYESGSIGNLINRQIVS